MVGQRQVPRTSRFRWVWPVTMAALAAACRGATARWPEGPTGLWAAFGLCALGLTVAPVFSSLWRLISVGRLTERPARWPEQAALAAWMASVVVALLLWPDGWNVQVRPLSCWCTLFALLGGLVYLLDRIRGADSAKRLLLFMAWICVAWGGVAAILYACYVRPVVGGADFFYYLAYSRDMLTEAKDVYPGAYTYFPGVYAFWRTMWWASGGQLALLQSIHIGTVAAVAFLLAAITYTRTRHLLVALTMGLAFWTFASRYEGFQGTVEPLALIPALIGVWVWNGAQEERWRRAGLAALALGWGAATWLRQHAALLAGGWCALIFEWLWPHRATWKQLAELFAVPVLIATIVVGATLAEGRGLQSLATGLAAAQSYEQRGTLLENLYHQVRNDESFALIALIATAGAIRLSLPIMLRRIPWPNNVRFALVLLCSALCAIYPLKNREYYHYMLLVIPNVLLLLLCWMEPLRKYLPTANSPWTCWWVFFVSAFPFFYTGSNLATFHFWRWSKPDLRLWRPWYEDPAVATDLSQLQHYVRGADQRLFIIPPHRVEPFLLWRLRSSPEIGYGFDPPPPEKFPWDAVDFVLVIEPQFDAPTHRAVRHRPANQRLIDALPAKGFRPISSLPTMILYQRVRRAADD